MKEIVAAGESRSINNELRNYDEQYNSAEQDYPRQQPGDPGEHVVQRLAVEEEKWNRGAVEQPSGREVRMLTGRIRAKTEIECNR